MQQLARRGGQASTPKKRLACLRNLAAIASHKPATQCPNEDCQSTRTRAYSARRGDPVRYHKCHDCGTTFKSVEKIVVGEPLTTAEKAIWRRMALAAGALRA